MNKKIAIIMCMWKRLEKLEEFTLKGLQSQTEKDFTLYIWNNNPDNVDGIAKILNMYKDLDINVVHSPKNIGGFGRFEMAKLVADKHDIIIMIDDDQKFNNKMVEIFVDEYDNNALKSRWTWRFGGNTYTHRGRIEDGGKSVHYCGTGGLVAPSWIFKTPEVFQIPQQFLFVEDLWLSYVCDAILGIELISIKDSGFIGQVVDGKDQFGSLISTKNEFMKYLTGTLNWKLK